MFDYTAMAVGHDHRRQIACSQSGTVKEKVKDPFLAVMAKRLLNRAGVGQQQVYKSPNFTRKQA
ncbi:MAG: hypothetical protein ABI579_00965 [Candidatus Sumerlaeota bacterium]